MKIARRSRHHLFGGDIIHIRIADNSQWIIIVVLKPFLLTCFHIFNYWNHQFERVGSTLKKERKEKLFRNN